MSFQATMEIDGKNLNIKECTFDFAIDLDMNGRPASNVRLGLIHLVLESTTEFDFFAWMKNPNEWKDGKITFLKRDMASSYKTLKFKKSICSSYREHFQDTGTIPMISDVTISAQWISLGGETLENDWYVHQGA